MLVSLGLDEQVHVLDRRTRPPGWWLTKWAFVRAALFVPGRKLFALGSVRDELTLLRYDQIHAEHGRRTGRLTSDLLRFPRGIREQVYRVSPALQARISAAQQRVKMTLMAQHLAASADGARIAAGVNVGGRVHYIFTRPDGSRSKINEVPTSNAMGDAPGYLQVFAWDGARFVASGGQPVGQRPFTALAFGRPRYRLATASLDGRLRLWSCADGLSPVAELTSDGGPLPPARALAFGPGGVLASGHDDGAIRVWGPDGALRQTLRAHRGGITGLVWHAERLLSSSAERELAVWVIR